MREIKLRYVWKFGLMLVKQYYTAKQLIDGVTEPIFTSKKLKGELAGIYQCTGLKDKNGVEIYEGDIVKSYFYGGCFNDVAEIKYDDRAAAFIYDSAEQDAFVYGSENNQLEVIGNIYENPELIKES